MMKYKFRGKRVDNSEWVYGSLLHGENIVLLSGLAYPVNPDSVGMWTGLKDKNGVEIYQRDILRLINESYNPECGDNPFVLSEVFFDRGAFYVGKGMCVMEYENYEIEVIGNTTDNPDLLGDVE